MPEAVGWMPAIVVAIYSGAASEFMLAIGKSIIAVAMCSKV